LSSVAYTYQLDIQDHFRNAAKYSDAEDDKATCFCLKMMHHKVE